VPARTRDAAERVATPLGEVVIAQLAASELDAAIAALGADEQAHARMLAGPRRVAFVAGRTALHAAAPQLATVAVLAGERGAPAMPTGWTGSIAHKLDRAGGGAVAAAIAAHGGDASLGVDLEHAVAPRQPIERRILTARELPFTDRRLVSRAFAIKEAIYKAVDPFVRRYVAFTEVAVRALDDGTCEVDIVDATRLPVAIEAWWGERDGMWLAVARARRAATMAP